MFSDYFCINAGYKPIQSELSKEGKQINCVDYMRKFILEELKLTNEESAILEEIRNYNLENMTNKQLKLLHKRRCKVCGKIKSEDDFYYYLSTCKDCYNAERKQKRKK